MTPDQLTNIIIALIAGLTGSGGCSVVLYLLQRRDKKKDGRTEEDKQRDEAMKRQSKLLLGLAHDRIVYLGCCYSERGYITKDEYENLHDYLYEPYLAEGGNGTAKKVMSEVERLPLHENQGGLHHEENRLDP